MKFFKFNASGNDFVFFLASEDESESKDASKYDFSELAKRLCDRHEGIGADGLVAIFKGSSDNHIIWRFYNLDGSEASMCGNASRAAALFACEQGLVDASKTIFLHTLAGVIEANVSEQMSHPALAPLGQNIASVPKLGCTASVSVRLSAPKKLSEPFCEDGLRWYFYDTGVPHLVAFVEDIEAAPFELAPRLRAKYNANVNFVCELGGELFVRTFERGVEAETLACGTGMCAAALAYRASEPIKSGVKSVIRPRSGEIIKVFLHGDAIYFEGLVNSVFSTEI